MSSLSRAVSTVIGASVALTLSGAAVAQTTVTSPKIVISNVTPNIEIPLANSSQVQFEADGDLVVQCRLDSANKCPNSGGGDDNDPPPVGAPAAFTLTPSSTSVNSGTSFTLSWNSADSEACYAVSPASITGWTSGNRVLSNSGQSSSITINNGTQTAATYTFEIRCFNESGSRTVSSATVTVNPGPIVEQPTEYCNEYYTTGGRTMPTGANFTGHGFQKTEVNFGTIWNGITPGDIDVLRGVPGPHLAPAANRYLSIPFTMTTTTGPLSQFRANWNQSQLPDTPSGAVSVTVSPCPGDFRPSTGFGVNPNDLYSTNLCRGAFGNTGVITVDAADQNNGCYAPPGKRMYINIAVYNMFGSTPTGITCIGGNTACGVMMRMD